MAARNVQQRRGPRHRFSGEVPSIASEEFRAHTEGLSNRLPLPSLEAMRAGTVLSPHGLVRRYLLSARRIGLPKSWALQFLTFVSRTIDSQWPMEQTPLRVLEERAMQLESVDNAQEKRNDLEHSAITLRERISSLTAEIVSDQLCLAKLERDLEDM